MLFPPPITLRLVSIEDPPAVKRVVDEFVGLLEEHRRVAHMPNMPGRADQMRAIDDQLMLRHGQVKAIAEQVNPTLVDLIYLRVHTSPFKWKFDMVHRCALLLKGAIDRSDETQKMLGLASMPVAHLSTPEQRSQYGRALLQAGATSEANRVQSKEVAQDLGFSDDIRDDVETFLSGAGLIKFVTFGPTVCLTHAGRRWVEEQDASLDEPPPGSRTVIVNIGPGASVGAVQAGADHSVQISRVEVNTTEAITAWIADVRAWLDASDGVDADAGGELLAHLEHLGDEAAEPAPDPGRLKRALEKTRRVVGEIATSAAGSVAAGGLLEGADHLLKLL